jgi:hypothetical protein
MKLHDLKKYIVGALICALAIGASYGVHGADGFTNRLRATTPADALTPAAPVETLDFGLRYNGATWDRARIPAKVVTVALGAGTTETTIYTPASGKKFRLHGIILTPGAATTLTFKDNTAGTTIFVTRGTTDTPIVIPAGALGNGILSGAVDRVLTVTRGTSATLDGVLLISDE